MITEQYFPSELLYPDKPSAMLDRVLPIEDEQDYRFGEFYLRSGLVPMRYDCISTTDYVDFYEQAFRRLQVLYQLQAASEA